MLFRTSHVGVAAICVFLGLQSCKPVRGEQGASAKPQSSSLEAASGFSFGFVLSNENLPDFEQPAPGKFVEGATRDGNVIQLKKRVAFPKSNEAKGRLFLVFSENFGGRQIADASYEHRTVSPSNSIAMDSPRLFVSYDRDHRSYFIPLDDLSHARKDGLSSLDLQIFELSLLMSDGSRSAIEIRFYVKGDLPSPAQIRVSRVIRMPEFFRGSREDVLRSQREGLEKGWVVLTEVYANPTSQPLLIWLSADQASYQVETELSVKLDWTPVTGGPLPPNTPEIEPDLHLVSRGALDKIELSLRGEGKDQARVIRRNSRVPVRLEPGQKIEAEWRVMASQKYDACTDGAPVSRMIWICDISDSRQELRRAWSPECRKHSDDLAVLDVPSEIRGNWVVSGYQISGDLKDEMWVTEEVDSLDHAQAEGLARVIPAPKVAARNSRAMDAPLYSCQGIF